MPGRPARDTEPAHLLDPAELHFTIDRYPVPARLAPVARRFWIPVWDVPAGRESPQHVLQYPVCLIVVTDEYARFYGVASGLSTTTLTGRGWAVGLMFQPAAGYLLTGRPVREVTDRFVDVESVTGLSGIRLADRIRAVMRDDPRDEDRRAAARAVVEDHLATLLPVDEEGAFVNAVVETVETTPELLRVDDLCQRFGVAERTLQRVLHKRVGITPKWLIRRRRLHEAADRLRDSDADLAAIASDLGYADQAHLTRDFRAATGLTPGRFAARFRSGEGP